MPKSWSRYLTPGPAHRRLGLVCLGVGTSTGRLATQTARTLDCYALVLVSRGGGRLRFGGQDFTLSAPTLFWLLPGVEHGYAPEGGGWNEWWVTFDGDAARGYQTLGYIPKENPVAPLAEVAPLEAAFTMLARACRSEHPDTDVDAAVALHHVIATTRRCVMPSSIADMPVLAALLRDACLPITIKTHARNLNIPEAELRDATRRAAGCSPKEFVLRARLSRAKDLLATTDLPVAAVAMRVGYDDPAYFTRLFTRRTGTPPGRFRQLEKP
ncbi:MAG TPA: AraC family transcriptional regulator [Candidatus Limnocylindrales bacterium]